MKTTSLLAGLGLVVSLATFADGASAGITDSLGTWEGSGTTMEVSGKDLGAFTAVVTRKSAGKDKVRMDGTVKLANGQAITIWQDIEERGPNGFTISSGNGTGGGQCFANGMCQSYEQRADGHAFATTIAKDDANHLRILITELDHGQAIRFIQQTLTKKS